MTQQIRLIVDAAERIAQKANECCHRSDGYEEDIAAFAQKEIEALLKSNKDTSHE